MTDEFALHKALVRARGKVDELMTFWEITDGVWREESATDTLCQAAAPYVKPVVFNRTQEAETGADWLWWWMDDTGACFGMLSQAKNLKRRGDSWHVDVEHANKKGEQIALLSRTAAHFDVAPVYVLYSGSPTYRAGLDCGLPHTAETCAESPRAGVSVISTMLVQDLRTLSGPTLGQEMLHYSAPLEDLADPGLRGNPVRDLPGRRCGPALTAFLKDPQYGARSVAKEIFRQLSEARRRQFSMATDERTTHGESKVFPELPTDRGHFPRPYFPEVLCGLRTALPGYARDALEGRTVPTGITDKLAGIIFVRI